MVRECFARRTLYLLLVGLIFTVAPTGARPIGIAAVPQFAGLPIVSLLPGVTSRSGMHAAQFFDPTDVFSSHSGLRSPLTNTSPLAGQVINMILFGRNAWLDLDSAAALAGALRAGRPHRSADLPEYVLEAGPVKPQHKAWQYIRLDDAGNLGRAVDAGTSILVGTGLVLIYRAGRAKR